MFSFLRGCKLWHYVTGDIKNKDEDDDMFADQLEIWDNKNHQILTGFRNTFIPAIQSQFGCFDMVKQV